MPESRAPPNGVSQVANVEAVDPHRAGDQRLAEALRALARAGEHGRGEPVGAVVGHRDRLRLVGEALQREHRPEDLGVQDLGAGRHRVEERRRVVQPVQRLAAEAQARALLDVRARRAR